PVKVQGEGASAEMVQALGLVNRELDVDVIVLTRGGGSLEDLWAFNQEDLALAIRASRIPVLSAVGHEIDITISDLAADVRAPTPSAAAEILVVEKEALEDRLRDLAGRLHRAMRIRHGRLGERIHTLAERLRDPGRKIADTWMRMDELTGRLVRVMERAVRGGRTRLATEARSLMRQSPEGIRSLRGRNLAFLGRSLIRSVRQRIKDQRTALFLRGEKMRNLNPRSILERGYSITLKLPERRVLKSGAGLREGDRVRVVLAEGELGCLVEEVGEGA
ncbi:MAG: exodeoxyribonuclease VII large subunit, partial [Deltaproteobacteria bacterium]|nr:exodeoxyribonuclease VII large subunit [Deltaproteobacteria bacterium]